VKNVMSDSRRMEEAIVRGGGRIATDPTRYDGDVLRGFGKRRCMWDVSLEVPLADIHPNLELLRAVNSL
jgi:hypothetical protein